MFNLHDASIISWRNTETGSEIPGIALARAGFSAAPEAVHVCQASGPNGQDQPLLGVEIGGQAI